MYFGVFMKKKIVSILILSVLVMCSLFAEQAWYSGKILKEYEAVGLKNVSSKQLEKIVDDYIGQPFSDETFSEMQRKINSTEGIEYIQASVSSLDDEDKIKLTITFHELPLISEVVYEGNDRVKSSDINAGLNHYAAGKFIDITNINFVSNGILEVQNLYQTKGFDILPVSMTWNLDESKNTVELHFSIEEGVQTRIVKIEFEGNTNVSSSVLRKGTKTKFKSLFYNGLLDKTKLKADEGVILANYANLGYIDAKIVDTRIDLIPSENEKFAEVSVTYVIEEGKQWYFGGLKVSGNTVYSNEELESLITIKDGAVLNMQTVNEQISVISDKYYNNGYIGCQFKIEESKDEDNNRISYNIILDEGEQCHVEKILITGLTKTKEYVMRREVTLQEGKIFSKDDLITSAQNIYNTGLLSDINYDIYFGEAENGIIVEFKVTEGQQMDIQFGATFGGNVDGFPVSGFLSWSNHNLLGTAKDISVSTNLSPDSQSLSISLGDNWFKNYRWANSFSINFSHNKYEGELQNNPASEYYDGRNSEDAFPLGIDSYEKWKMNNGEYPASEHLMDYRLISIGLGYNTGYTYVWNKGRLSLNGGLSVSLNKAFYDDDKYEPFEYLTKKYHDAWQLSNKLNFGVQWDGRDYITNTTKGYILNATFTYAGGLLQGLSNYQKVSTRLAGYLKLASFGEEEKQNNLMFAASTNASIMLPQLYKNDEDTENKGFGFHDPHLGATKYEMLYIDGMTIARGHDIIFDQVFLWDNMAEISYPLIKNVLNAEVFASATAIVKDYDDFSKGLNWYYSAGFGVKFKVPGFPLGLYLVKTGTKLNSGSFNWTKGSIFNGNDKDNAGMKFVLAISTSMI